MRTISATVNASVYGGYTTPDELIRQDPDQAVSRVNLSADVPDGWVKVGTATVNPEELNNQLITMTGRKLDIQQESFA